MNEAMRQRARELVNKGYTPLRLKGKAPILKSWQGTAMTFDAIMQWQDSDHNLGLRTGDKGLVVLDFDGLEGYTVFCENFPELVQTHTVKTGSGNGVHVYFTVQGELPKSTGQLNVPGGKIEIKAKGRQVVIPPSIHPDTNQPYEVMIAGSMKVLTRFNPIQRWIDQYNPRDSYQAHPETNSVSEEESAHSAYAKSALNNIAGELAGIKEGGRNDALVRAAWKLAHFVRRGDLSEGEVRNALEGAMFSNGAISGDGKKAFEATFQSGFQDGYGDRSWEPEVYNSPPNGNSKWKEQRRRDFTLPGDWQGYTPSDNAHAQNGVKVFGRTRIVKRQSLFSDLLERIQDDTHVPTHVPIPFPLKVLHRFGGQCLISQVGKIAGLVGPSGSGKTSCLETVLDAYAMMGILPWIWTPEWTPEEMAERALQRHGGVTQDQLYAQDIDNYRHNVLGLPSDPALRIAENQWQRTAEIFRMMRSWRGDVYFMHNVLLTIDEMAEVIVQAKAEMKDNEFPRVLVLDYVQLLKANDVDDQEEKSIYNLIQRYKAMCEHYGLFGWVATQTTKEEARRAKSDGETFSGSAVLNVTKNSRGTTGKVRIPSEPSRLRIVDQHHPNQEFSKEAYYLGSQAGRYINDDPYNLFITLNPEYQ